MIMGVTPAVASAVAVFLMEINRSEWILLWSGLLGAIPAAVISAAVAAAVAAWVLNRSNIQQQVLAREAVNKQRELSGLQLREQRKEAAVVRERAAAANVIIAAQDWIVAVIEAGDAIAKHQGVFRAAVTRWRVELGLGPLSEELLDWPNVLFRAAGLSAWADLSGIETERTAAKKELTELVAVVMAIALAWETAKTAERGAAVDRLRARRSEFGEFREKWAGQVPEV